MAFIFRVSKFLGCIRHHRGFKIFPVSLNTRSTGAHVAGTENTLLLAQQSEGSHSTGFPLRLYPNLLRQFLLSAPVSSTNTSISGWPRKTCISRRYSAGKRSLLCLATITIFCLEKFETCRNLQMVLTCTQVPVSRMSAEVHAKVPQVC